LEEVDPHQLHRGKDRLLLRTSHRRDKSEHHTGDADGDLKLCIDSTKFKSRRSDGTYLQELLDCVVDR
jgi:hypothetical protein